MSAPTLTGDRRRILAERLLARQARPVPRRDPAAPAPLSFAQQRLWLADRMATRPEQFCVPLAVRLSGPVDADRLRDAFQSVVDRHEVLRTRYRPGADGPVQIVAASAAVDFAVDPDLDPATAAEYRYDLETDLPLRVRLIPHGPHDAVLVLTVHHIASDSWSVGLLFDEVREAYAAGLANRPADLPELPVQYADYALWQHAQARGDRLPARVEAARRALEGAPDSLELPHDRPRPATRTGLGAFHRSTLPPGLAARVHAAARAAKVSPFTLLLALYRVLLGRHAGTGDVVIGIPAAGRGRPEIDRLIGCFLNMLVVRGDTGAAGTVSELIAAEHRRVLAAFEAEVPFERLVEAVAPARGTGVTPLFQTTFSYRPAEPALGSLGRAAVTPYDLPGGVALYDLALDLTGTADGGIAAVWAYDDELFDAGTVAALAGRFSGLVAAAVAAPAGLVADLPVLTPVEHDDLLRHGRAGVCGEDAGADLCTAVWSAGPGPAVSDAFGERDHAWLTGYADRLAAHLQSLGVRSGDRVGVLVGRRAELPAVLLAVARTGAAWVPLDPAHPVDRLRYVLDDCGARALVTDGAPAGLADGIPVVEVDAERPDAVPDPVPRSPERPAYLIYTSGSTGRPKGVAVPHAALSRVFRALREELRLGRHTRFVAVSTVAFDVAQLELLLPLTAGGHVYVADAVQATEPGALAALIDAWRPSTVHATPSLWRLLAQLDWRPDPGIQVLCGGEAMPATVAAWLSEHVAEAYNSYGPTEATIFASLHRLGGDAANTPIGWPLTSHTMYVLDARLRPVPPGAPGELVVGGPALAHGYPRLPARTAAQFVPDPYGPPGSRMYRTGDIVRVGPDGRLRFLGRDDHQIKVRGFRIEAAEVEAALTGCPGVTGAVVTAGRDASGDARLIGHLTGDVPAPAALRATLRERLPDYMVPSLFVTLDAFPLTPTGKVDRAALPEPGPVTGDPADRPQGPTEEVVARIWGELLGLDPVPATANFFDLGGHSLTLARLAFALGSEFGVEVAFNGLFERQTVTEQAALVEELLVAQILALGDDEADEQLRRLS
ncbi:amino acid adenylation domain-containing protein [Plantactinospora sp. KLBMP9567]|uniref:amino acid adenylation domain-containing protein n=1 Tax=Plantactinospora sp. KLBMP9567 TaxID=3085900 RepID=UPI00298242D3|nr:amino acid adenylation domain-containing protein [Plantactinospora sp. KLBMP9567]MDW5322286.1 amino acid adenylation domain-containing protein [Plantactinospora sp. KLBMP9567]